MSAHLPKINPEGLKRHRYMSPANRKPIYNTLFIDNGVIALIDLMIPGVNRLHDDYSSAVELVQRMYKGVPHFNVEDFRVVIACPDHESWFVVNIEPDGGTSISPAGPTLRWAMHDCDVLKSGERYVKWRRKWAMRRLILTKIEDVKILDNDIWSLT